VKKILEKQWDNAKFALGMSGTIFVPRTAVELTAGYILAKLGVPSGRSRIVGPIATSWVFGSAKLFVPDETLVPDFCYPGRDDQPGDEESELAPSDKYEAWCETISAAVAMAAKSAAGGTLVLCTSFHDIEGIAKNLSRSLGSRLMKHERGVSIQMQKERFIAEAKDNTKPVWLATGAAWVGLNITDVHERAEDDFCLTDLVVVRAPMSLNRTSTHFTRRRSWGMLADIFEAAIRFRQGLGRLIRRQGLADRRIWLLDGRLFDRQFPMFNRLLPVLSPYEKKYFSKLTSDR